MMQTSERDFLIDLVSRGFDHWIASHPTATLTDLRQFLQDVDDEFLSYDGSELLADNVDELGVAAEYLREFSEIEDDQTFDYRLGNLEEDIQQVGELIELVGETFKVSRLHRSKKKAVK